MQVVITIEGSQADVFEQEPDELVQFSADGEYTCVDGCGVLTYPESELTGMAGLERDLTKRSKTVDEFTSRLCTALRAPEDKKGGFLKSLFGK